MARKALIFSFGAEVMRRFNVETHQQKLLDLDLTLCSHRRCHVSTAILKPLNDGVFLRFLQCEDDAMDRWKFPSFGNNFARRVEGDVIINLGGDEEDDGVDNKTVVTGKTETLYEITGGDGEVDLWLYQVVQVHSSAMAVKIDLAKAYDRLIDCVSTWTIDVVL
ncbi:hypothetical protein RJ640_017985, partial [Escallonia rubra]